MPLDTPPIYFRFHLCEMPKLQSATLPAVLWECQRCSHTNNAENNKRHCVFVPGLEGWDCSIKFCQHCNCQQGGGAWTTMAICCDGRHADTGGTMPTQGHGNHNAYCFNHVSKLCTLKEKYEIMNKAQKDELAMYNA